MTVRVVAREIYEKAPNAFFKELGLGAIARVLGGVLPGVYLPEVMWPASTRLSNQGGFFMALDPAAFLPRDEFNAQMERFVDDAAAMEPFPGQVRILSPTLSFGWEESWQLCAYRYS